MWAGKLRDIIATKHLIEIIPRSFTENTITNGQGMKIRDAMSMKIIEKVDSGVIERYKSSRAITLVTVQNRDGLAHFCED